MASILDSYGPIDPNVVKNNGHIGVARYISQVSGKCITPSEFQGYLDAELTVSLVYEDNATDALGGTAVGAAKGLIARQVIESLGIFNPVVFFGVDTDLSSDMYQTAFGCIEEFAATAGCIAGVYGPGPLILFCFERGIKYGWEPGATAWDQGIYLGQLYQRHYNLLLDGYRVDVDEILADDYGQWPRPLPPAPPSEEDLMFCHDPVTGGIWGTDSNGSLYAYKGAPYVPGMNLNQHPEYHAGSAESGGVNPCVGIEYWKSGSDDGVTYFTKPQKPPAEQGGPYSTYSFKRDGTPA